MSSLESELGSNDLHDVEIAGEASFVIVSDVSSEALQLPSGAFE